MRLSVRPSSSLPLVTLLLLAGGGPRAASTAAAAPHRLVVLATEDLKGKTSPCGCHTPKGGFSRMASFVDSTRAAGQPILFVDAGGWFPDQDGRTDLAEFMVRSLVRMGVGAVGVGPRDLRHGVLYLEDLVHRSGAPVTCANLADRGTRKPLFPTSRIVDVGGVRVGVFALYSD